ncbi:MAG: 2-C-methyl-D-erythritol 2,4-cyclodiphosphate synthase [Sediminibacterium sp.]
MSVRIGYGIDFHRLVEGRDLVIGGVQIPHHKGALGHSDAEVLLQWCCGAEVLVQGAETMQRCRRLRSEVERWRGRGGGGQGAWGMVHGAGCC